MSLHDIHASDVQNVLLATGDFAVEVVYTPRIGLPSTIRAIVQVAPVDSRAETTRHSYRSATVTIANDILTGIVTPAEGDTITLTVRPGYPEESVRVVSVETRHALHVLEVVK